MGDMSKPVHQTQESVGATLNYSSPMRLRRFEIVEEPLPRALNLASWTALACWVTAAVGAILFHYPHLVFLAIFPGSGLGCVLGIAAGLAGSRRGWLALAANFVAPAIMFSVIDFFYPPHFHV